VPENLDSTFVKAVQINSPKCSFFKVARWFDFTNFITEKKIAAIYCTIRRNGLYTGIVNSGYLLCGTCRQKLSVQRHWLKLGLSQIFLHFGQFYFYSRQVCYKRLVNWTDTLTLNGFTRNAKHGFNSWKWSELAWNFSNSLTIYFSIFPFCGLQLPLREKRSFPFWHWENERKLSTMCVFKIFIFFWELK